MTRVSGVQAWPARRALLCAAGGLAMSPAAAWAAPAACNGVPQITDASGDGHHASTDVLDAWLSEASGHLQAVIRVRVGSFTPEHDDAELDGSGLAFLFSTSGRTNYVRVTAPPAEPAAATYDYGSWSLAGGFVSAGATTGAIEASPGAGTVTIDVPAPLGLTAGTTLRQPFVLTYDGITGGNPDWVDRAPGGTDPAENTYGADDVLGSCGAVVIPTGLPGADPASGGVTSVQLTARARLTGGGTTTVSGRVFPAASGVPVAVTRTARRTTVTTAVTGPGGAYSLRVPIGETTQLRAVASGIASQTVTVTVRSTVRITVRPRAGGGATVAGTVRPALPGRVLLLRTTSPTPSATLRLRRGRHFTFRLTHPVAGHYQAVFVPSGNRAERSTSNAGTIR